VILDSSALVAMALDEPERDQFLDRVARANEVRVGAPTLVETTIVLWRRTGADPGEFLARLVPAGSVVVVAFGDAHWREAIAAWSRFGTSRHPANLNFGDCLAYATAKVAGLPLLAKGEDFAQTDLELV
jgi:ribonuclease VapC